MAGSDSCSLLLGCNWSAAVAGFDRFWRGSAETYDSVLAGCDVNTFSFTEYNVCE